MRNVIDWTHLFEKHRGQWVALAKDEITVVGAGATAREAYDAARGHVSTPILHRVPRSLDAFAGYAI